MSVNKQRHRKLILILGDQLNLQIAALEQADKKQDVIVMMEIADEANYVKHHPFKIILLFSAMRHFAAELVKQGYTVHYIKFCPSQNPPSFTENLRVCVKQFHCESVWVTEPGEYRVLSMMQTWQKEFAVPVTILPDTRFYCSIKAFQQWAKGKKQLRLENFYRMLRKQTGILMQGNKPQGGKWNYDKENRAPPKQGLQFKPIPKIKPDKITTEVIDLVKKHFKQHFGSSDNFSYAVTRRDALKLLRFFIKYQLKDFGTYQDAMLVGEYFLYHSNLSMYLNCGLLLPREVIDAVIEAYHEQKIALHSIEGFVRQILGWREFVRGIYWLYMPKYAQLNFFIHKAPLPDFYWTTKTEMACLQQVITQTYETATSHHIQRLMITGNFALLMGVAPEAVCEWYLAVYADAYEWVELPNTLGMSQYADGGVLGSKPYISSGNYINKMSNFCKDCVYNVKHKLESDACPFNFLYWAFLIKHEKHLKANMRLKFAYRHVEALSKQQREAYLNRAKEFEQNLSK